MVATRVRPFGIRLRGSATFLPVSSVVFVPLVQGSPSASSSRSKVRSGPLQREIGYAYHPHVTVAHDLPDDCALPRVDARCRRTTPSFQVFGLHACSSRARTWYWRPQRDFTFGGGGLPGPPEEPFAAAVRGLVKHLRALQDRLDRDPARRTAGLPSRSRCIKKFGEDSSGQPRRAHHLLHVLLDLPAAAGAVLGARLRAVTGIRTWQHKIEIVRAEQLPAHLGRRRCRPRAASWRSSSAFCSRSTAGWASAKTAQTAWDIVYRSPETDQPGFIPKTLRALRLVVVGGLGPARHHVDLWRGRERQGDRPAHRLGRDDPRRRGAAAAQHVAVHPDLPLVDRPRRDLPATRFRARSSRRSSFAVLQTIASAFDRPQAASARATYGTFGTVIVLLSWFYLQSQALLLAAQVNVVKQYRLWPRALTEPPPPKPTSAPTRGTPNASATCPTRTWTRRTTGRRRRIRRRRSELFPVSAGQTARTLSACGPFWPSVTSNSTRWPSSRDL